MRVADGWKDYELLDLTLSPGRAIHLSATPKP